MIKPRSVFVHAIHMRAQFLALVLVMLGSSCLLSNRSYAQVTSGDILGTVTDQSGAVVPGAKVHIVNTSTKVPQDLTTNSDGDYEVPYLVYGTYEVTIEAAGFKTFHQTNINLNTDQKYRVDAKLQVGNAAQSVTVSANAAVLQTDQSQIADTIDFKSIEEVPNVNHNPLEYVLMEPGVIPTGAMLDPQQVNSDVTGRQNFSSYVVNGGQPMMSNITLDGANDQNPNANEIATVPNMESVGEIRVITNSYSAEYGRASSGVINFTTKSGGNNIHGAIYDYFRNRDMNANTFGNNTFGRYHEGVAPCFSSVCDDAPQRPRAPFSTNQFGGNISGPLRIPHIYDGTNKTFVFTSFEGLRRVQGASTYYTVPTALEKVGNFSQTLNIVSISGVNTPSPVQIYMPFVNTSNFTVVGSSYTLIRDQACSNGPALLVPSTGNVSANPACPNGGIANVIPTTVASAGVGGNFTGKYNTYLDPTYLTAASFYPLPNIPPINTDNTENYFTNLPTWTDTNQFSIKLDQNFSEKAKAFFRYTSDWTYTNPANIYGQTQPNANLAYPAAQYNPSVTLGYDWTMSPSSILEMRLNVARVNLNRYPLGGLTYDLTSCSSPGLCFAPNMLDGLPSQVFPTFQAVGVGSSQSWAQLGGPTFGIEHNHTTVYDFTPNFTKIHGAWTHKIGGEYMAYLYNYNQPQANDMIFSTGGTGYTNYCNGTGCPVTPVGTSEGWSPATSLMGGETTGYFGSGQYSSAEPVTSWKNSFWAVYSQNDWKATKKMTVNLGMRWEMQVPLTERYNRESQFNMTGTNITGTPGIYQFAGVNGIPRYQTNLQKTNFAPRIGFAYRLGDKTVIRSAYGISYVPTTGVGSGGQGFGIDGFRQIDYSQTLPSTSTPPSQAACAPQCANDDILLNPFDNSFSGSTSGQAAGDNPNSPILLGYPSVTAYIRTDYKIGYMQQWNFTVQRQLPLGNSLQVAYVGSKGSHIGIQQAPINQTDDINPSILSSAVATLSATDVNPLSNKVTNPFFNIITQNTNLDQATITNLLLDEPFPAYGSITRFQDRIGAVSYNALQVLGKHNFQHGVMIQAAYTWSHALDYGNGYTGQIQTGNSQGGLFWNWNNRRLDYAPSAFDKTHVATISYVWHLPLGVGQPFVTHTPVATQVLEGWTVAGLTTLAGGFPLGITGTGFGRPNLIASPKLPKSDRVTGTGSLAINMPTGQTFTPSAGYVMYFNPDAFQGATITAPVLTNGLPNGTTQNLANPYYYGTSPRLFDSIRTPGVNNFDLTLSRTFNLTERYKLEARAEAYNAFNRTMLGSPGVGFGGPNLTTAGAIGQNTSTTFGAIQNSISQNAPGATTNTARFMEVSMLVRW